MDIIKLVQDNCFNQGQSYQTNINEYRISSVGYCPRKIQLDKILPEEKKPFDTKTLGTFAVGNAIHEYIQGLLPKDVMIAQENQIRYKYKEIELVGHFDLLLISENGLLVVDIKSAKAKSMYYRHEEAQDSHIEQANTYASILGTKGFSILYVNKDTFEMIQHNYKTDFFKFQIILDKIRIIYMNIIERELSEVQTGWLCDYCDFSRICDNLTPEDVPFFTK